jgi:hypothetical protein
MRQPSAFQRMPEADGTLAWDSTVIEAGGMTGLGYT